MKAAARVVTFSLLAILAGQAGAGPLRDLIASRRGASNLPAGVRVLRDVAYGTDKAQRFDVYLPKDAANAPVIFMVHGGAWKGGDKSMQQVVEHKVAHWSARGFILISTDYRMLPGADPLTQARDVASAIAAAQQRAAAWGGDRHQFILMGHSAGAHLVALLNSSTELKGKLNWLGTVALDSAALDIEQIMQQRHMGLYDEPFGANPAYWRRVSPFAQLVSAAQPLLAVCSSQRSDSCEQARRFAAKGTGLGMRIEVLPQDLNHMQINDTLGQDNTYTQAVDRFIDGLLPARP